MPQPCPNDSGECDTRGCDATESSIWYGKKGAKYCKHCYDTALGPKKRKGTAGMQAVLAAPETAGDTLLRIIKICGVRHARALEPAPAFFFRSSHFSVCAAFERGAQDLRRHPCATARIQTAQPVGLSADRRVAATSKQSGDAMHACPDSDTIVVKTHASRTDRQHLI